MIRLGSSIKKIVLYYLLVYNTSLIIIRNLNSNLFNRKKFLEIKKKKIDMYGAPWLRLRCSIRHVKKKEKKIIKVGSHTAYHTGVNLIRVVNMKWISDTYDCSFFSKWRTYILLVQVSWHIVLSIIIEKYFLVIKNRVETKFVIKFV